MYFLIFETKIFSLIFRFFIDGMCVVALVLAIKTIRGAMVHPMVVMLLLDG